MGWMDEWDGVLGSDIMMILYDLNDDSRRREQDNSDRRL